MIGLFLVAALLPQTGQPRVAVDRAGGWKGGGPSGGFVNVLAVDPTNALTLYAGSSAGVFKSEDGAQSWTAVSPDLPSNVHSLAIDPTNPARIYFSTGDDWQGSHDYRSDDGGRTWTPMTPIVAYPFLVPINVTALAVDPHSPDTLVAGVTVPNVPSHDELPGAGQLFRSVNRGESWTQIFSMEGAGATQILFDRQDPATIYAVLAGKVFKSVDSGQTWNAASPANENYANSIAQSASDPLRLFAATADGGVFRSPDGGATWESAGNGLPSEVAFGSIVTAAPSVLFVGSASGVFRSDDEGSSWHLQSGGSHHLTLIVDPSTPATLYSIYARYGPGVDGVEKSADSGVTWSALNDGLNALGINAVAADPRAPATVFAGEFGRIFKSLDRGRTWVARDIVTEGNLPYVFDFSFDPFDEGTLYLATSAGVFESVDGGDHWTLISASLTGTDGYVTSVVADPLVREQLFAGSASGRVFRTEDRGGHWTSVGPAQTNGNNFDGLLAFDPRSHMLFFGSAQGVFRSVNSGSTWQPTSVRDEVYALEAAPDGTAVWAGSRGGLFRSVDVGSSWEQVAGLPPLPGPPDVFSIAIDPVRSSEIFVSMTGLLGVYRSFDGGANWQSFNDGLILEPPVFVGVGRLSVDAAGDRVYGAGVGVLSRPMGPRSTRRLPR
jgi:photosystem II stability/assembly factor-like uncharacterized protein